MKLFVFAVYDAAAEAYLDPVFFATKGQMLRSFTDACNSSDHMFSRHAKDYTLFHIGMYDPSSGKLEPLATPDALGVALEFVEAA